MEHAANFDFTALFIGPTDEHFTIYTKKLNQLNDIKFNFARVESGAEGLKFCQAQQPDCVILEYNLTLDELNFLAHLSKQLSSRVPVIAMLEVGKEVLATSAMRHGAHHHIVKDTLGRFLELFSVLVERAATSILDRFPKRNADKNSDSYDREGDIVLRSITDGMCGVNAEGVITFANPAIATILGYSQKELIGDKDKYYFAS